MVTEWYRSGNEVVSRKIAGKKHIEGGMKVRGREEGDGAFLGQQPDYHTCILRICYVYPTYMVRN